MDAEKLTVQRCDQCQQFADDSEAADHVMELWQDELEGVPEWICVNFTTGTIWCRRCQTHTGLPMGPLRECAEHIEEFVKAHRNCKWDRLVNELAGHVQHHPTCQLHIPGCGCNCGLERLLKDMEFGHLMQPARDLHRKVVSEREKTEPLRPSGDYRGRLRHG